MIFCVSNEKNEKFPFEPSDLMEIIGSEALLQGLHPDNHALPEHQFFVNVVITDHEEMQEINKNSRGVDAPTDVLSFPAFTFDTPGIFREDALNAIEVQDQELDATWLGDIIIDAERVRSQAVDYGHSEKREFAFLLTHALLHLQGYDHETEDEAKVMEKLQESVLSKVGISRDI